MSKVVNRKIPPQYAMCRTWQHAWEYTTVERKGHDYLQGLRCIRCTTTKVVRVNAQTGERLGNSYDYPEGYQLAEGGPLSARERAELRLFEVTGHA